MSYQTSFLYAVPTFLSGVGATMDMGATMEQYNVSKNPKEADRKAMQSDWSVTGDDIYFAMKSYEQEQAA